MTEDTPHMKAVCDPRTSQYRCDWHKTYPLHNKRLAKKELEEHLYEEHYQDSESIGYHKSYIAEIYDDHAKIICTQKHSGTFEGETLPYQPELDDAEHGDTLHKPIMNSPRSDEPIVIKRQSPSQPTPKEMLNRGELIAVDGGHDQSARKYKVSKVKPQRYAGLRTWCIVCVKPSESVEYESIHEDKVFCLNNYIVYKGQLYNVHLEDDFILRYDTADELQVRLPSLA